MTATREAVAASQAFIAYLVEVDAYFAADAVRMDGRGPRTCLTPSKGAEGALSRADDGWLNGAVLHGHCCFSPPGILYFDHRQLPMGVGG
jgi:hypothetical protein